MPRSSLPTPRVFLVVLSIVACTEAEPVRWSVENDFDSVLWIDTDDGTLSPRLFARVGGDDVELVPSAAWLCLPTCGAPGGMIACAEVAAPIPRALAVAPGESVSVETEATMYYRKIGLSGDCAQAYSGTKTAEICYGPEAVDANGDAVALPEGDAPQLADLDTTVLDPRCARFEVPAGEGTVVLLSEGE